ncbi:hypothetical protein CYMTET_33091 [Cymbomonas tetramitiformis]|uniref:Uncharacterized protein n=1 Tax=Cymbomonas tetramitiformis TaxID=36881 RepID=A0AAE0FDP0_9CHLO|nr:hypothetical protein CYMTET_33091 [Cymbomonas tetramitiformis]
MVEGPGPSSLGLNKLSGGLDGIPPRSLLLRTFNYTADLREATKKQIPDDSSAQVWTGNDRMRFKLPSPQKKLPQDFARKQARERPFLNPELERSLHSGSWDDRAKVAAKALQQGLIQNPDDTGGKVVFVPQSANGSLTTRDKLGPPRSILNKYKPYPERPTKRVPKNGGGPGMVEPDPRATFSLSVMKNSHGMVKGNVDMIHRMLDIYVFGFNSLVDELVHKAEDAAPLLLAIWAYFVEACEACIGDTFESPLHKQHSADKARIQNLELELQEASNEMCELRAHLGLFNDKLTVANKALDAKTAQMDDTRDHAIEKKLEELARLRAEMEVKDAETRRLEKMMDELLAILPNHSKIACELTKVKQEKLDLEHEVTTFNSKMDLLRDKINVLEDELKTAKTAAQKAQQTAKDDMQKAQEEMQEKEKVMLAEFEEERAFLSRCNESEKKARQSAMDESKRLEDQVEELEMALAKLEDDFKNYSPPVLDLAGRTKETQTDKEVKQEVVKQKEATSRVEDQETIKELTSKLKGMDQLLEEQKEKVRALKDEALKQETNVRSLERKLDATEAMAEQRQRRLDIAAEHAADDMKKMKEGMEKLKQDHTDLKEALELKIQKKEESETALQMQLSQCEKDYAELKHRYKTDLKQVDVLRGQLEETQADLKVTRATLRDTEASLVQSKAKVVELEELCAQMPALIADLENTRVKLGTEQSANSLFRAQLLVLGVDPDVGVHPFEKNTHPTDILRGIRPDTAAGPLCSMSRQLQSVHPRVGTARHLVSEGRAPDVGIYSQLFPSLNDLPTGTSSMPNTVPPTPRLGASGPMFENWSQTNPSTPHTNMSGTLVSPKFESRSRLLNMPATLADRPQPPSTPRTASLSASAPLRDNPASPRGSPPRSRPSPRTGRGVDVPVPSSTVLAPLPSPRDGPAEGALRQPSTSRKSANLMSLQEEEDAGKPGKRAKDGSNGSSRPASRSKQFQSGVTERPSLKPGVIDVNDINNQVVPNMEPQQRFPHHLGALLAA